MDDDDFIPYDLPPEKRRRAQRVHAKRKHKQRDRYKPKQPKLVRHLDMKLRRFRLWARGNTRRLFPAETGYGIAYERCRETGHFDHP